MSFARTTIAAMLLFASLQQAASQEDRIEITMGHSDLVRLEEPAATVIIGDPRVADATLVEAGIIVVNARSLGTTNLIILNESGQEVIRAAVTVTPLDLRPRPQIRVILSGVGETHYQCGPTGCVLLDRATAATSGQCIHPEDIAPDGSRCGARAASIQPNLVSEEDSAIGEETD